MCNPAALIGLQVASGVAGFFGQRQQAQDLIASQQRTQQLLRQDVIQQQQALTRRQEEVGAQASVEISERIREAREERARLRVASGAAGLGFGTAGRFQAQSAFNEGRDVSRLERNRQQRTDELQREKKNRRTKGRNQIAQAGRPVNGPSLIGTGLRIGTSVAGTLANREE